MQRLGAIMGIIFVIGLLVIIGTRLSDDALGVLAGAACVGSAMVPVSIVLIWALLRRGGSGNGIPQNNSQYPPVIVVNPNGVQGLPPGYGGPPHHSLPAPSRGRDFKVIGSDVVDAEWSE